jgi:hypothetical protein
VGPVRVVVLDVLGKDCFEVPAAEDEHPVEALAPDGADHALADGVRPRLSGQSLASLWITLEGGDEPYGRPPERRSRRRRRSSCRRTLPATASRLRRSWSI